jgi:uncharacterized membrane protein YbhN (UPF0104 family)
MKPGKKPGFSGEYFYMKINPRLYPTILIVTFVLFLLIALLLGLRPVHGGGEGSAEAAVFIRPLLDGAIL